MDALPVSVVIPVRDRADMVGAAVASALAQTAPPAEVIVVDNASADDSGAVAAALGARVLTLAPLNGADGAPRGAGVVRNCGIDAAAQPWVAFLDSDDLWAPDLLARLWAHRDDGVLVSGTFVDTGSGLTRGNPSPVPMELDGPPAVLFPDNPIVTSATLARRELLLEAGGFGEHPVAHDLELWLRMLERGPGVSVPGPGGELRDHSGPRQGGSRAVLRASVREVLRQFEGRPWLTPRLRERVQVAHTWDELREMQAAGEWRGVARRAVWLLARPRRVSSLRALLRWRRRLRPG